MPVEKFLQSIDRRKFLKIASFTGVAGLIYPSRLLSKFDPKDLSRVVIVEDSTATSGTSIISSTVQVMMDSGVKSLAQLTDVGEAWKSLFPNITESNIIAIKVNARYSTMPTHPDVTNAVIDGLTQMSFNGTTFPENNIIIFDRGNSELQSCGYSINTSSSGVRCFGTTASGVGYSSSSYSVNGSSQKISSIVTNMADYMINIAVLKNHGSVAGVTLCLKNHFGTCDSPRQMHGSYGGTYIPALNALSTIQNKQYVNIIDALFGVYTGGPGGSPQFIANKIIMSQDIVAADYWGRELLSDNGCTTITQATHIDNAAQSPYNLGTNDPAQMDVVNITSPTTGVDPYEDTNVPGSYQLKQNYPNPFNNNTQIEFYAPKSADVQFAIYDINGRKVRNLVNKTVSSGWHKISWNGTNDVGMPVASGMYIGQLSASGIKQSIIMQMLK